MNRNLLIFDDKFTQNDYPGDVYNVGNKTVKRFKPTPFPYNSFDNETEILKLVRCH